MSEVFALAEPPTERFGFSLNGRHVEVEAAPFARLSHTLREALGARDVKVGCNAGDCGACTVLLDGEAVCACLVSTHQALGRTVETLAGLAEELKPLRAAFLRHGAAQCGICTPGMLVAAAALTRRTPVPQEADVSDALAGVLCRCTGYRKIIDAVLDAAPRAPEPQGDGHIGASVERLDGLRKVNGTEVFGDDAAPAGALLVRVIRSPHERAGFSFGDLAAFARDNGLTRILTAADIPGRNIFGVIPPFADQPVFAEGEARFRGEAVAAIVGPAEAVEAVNLDRFPVAYEPRPALLSPREAVQPGAHDVHAARPGNLMCRGLVRRGDAQAALDRADVLAHGTFTTPFVEHAYIEPEAGFARRVGERIEVFACTQAPVMDQESLADILGLPVGAVRIVPTAAGGGFGSKLDLSLQPYIALAAWVTGEPARITYTRTESMQSTTKRHPAVMEATIGATRDGVICGMRFHGTFDTGAYASWGPTVANRVPVHASGPYIIADYEAHSEAVHTNNPPAGAFRGFGVPQSAIAQEVLFEDLALALSLDPLEFRARNALRNGTPTVCGQVFAQGVGIGACLEALRPHWQRARAAADHANAVRSVVRHGVGLACGWYGCGNTSIPNPSTIKAGVRSDGRIVLHQGATDIGQGANTVVPQIFATALGVPLAALDIVGPDTDLTPDAGKTSASRQTFVTGNAARLAGEALRKEILRRANAGPDAAILCADGITVEDRGRRQAVDLSAVPDAGGYVFSVAESYDPPTEPLDENGQGSPYAVYGYAAHMVELSVDTALGTVRLTRITAAHDVGRAINPVLIEGQIHGGVAQGVGMALMEAYIPGRTENLHDYLIPTFGDIPPIESLVIEETDAHGPYGAKGLGEHVLIPTAPAILNAIRHATGARLTDVPATPDRVLAAIKGAS